MSHLVFGSGAAHPNILTSCDDRTNFAATLAAAGGWMTDRWPRTRVCTRDRRSSWAVAHWSDRSWRTACVTFPVDGRPGKPMPGQTALWGRDP